MIRPERRAAKMDPARALQRFPLAPPKLVDRYTRTEDVIVLCHLGVAQLTRQAWSLSIDGEIEHRTTLCFEDLARYPKVLLASVHQCCGSPFAPFEPTRRITNVTWAGARLIDVLADARPTRTARYVWSYGADSGEFSGVSVNGYCKDLPLERAGRDVLLAYEMNGEPLRPEHGFPVRLVVPGFYGTNSVKWLVRMTLAPDRARGPFTTRWYNDPVLDASGEETGDVAPVWSIAPESVIVSPASREAVSLGVEREIWGWAWAEESVSRVEVYTSDDDAWRPAELEPPRGHEWQRFSVPFKPGHRGPMFLAARATTASGQRQPRAGRRNAIHGVAVMVV